MPKPEAGDLRGWETTCGLARRLFHRSLENLAGMVGFEPTVHCTKNSCLTTWLHPNRAALSRACVEALQAKNQRKLLVMNRSPA